ncbi:Hypothetical conserved membrane protein PknM or conserved lipoprotein LppH [Mycobacteroides abscessus subsp. abscessus]|nr:Hypothetical conserved membrane protein PknM or conserved lipoprotein LppH [Mycobacteroides abscessus subsp. abscessus]
MQPSAIDRLMFSQREAERVMGVGLPNVQRQSATFALDTDRPDCGSVVLASVSSYDRSPYMAAHSQALWDHPGWYTLVDRSVLQATVDVRDITQVDNVLAVSYARNDSAYAFCQHVLLGERNVAIDIRTCSTVSKSDGERAFELMKIVGPRVWEV